MIGYINPYKDELKIKHLNFYNSLYCSLCFNIKKYNNFLRFFLPKDIIFFYLLFISTSDNIKYNFTKKKCPINPLKKVNLYNENKFFKLFSEISVLIILLKIYDFIYDSKVIIVKKFLKSFTNKIIKKLNLIKAYFPEPQKYFTKYFNNEKTNYESLLKSLELIDIEKDFFEIYFNNLQNYFLNFNNLFISMFPFDYLNSNISILIKNISQNIIKIVILVDSINDFYKDLKKNEDNILLPLYLYFFIKQNNKISSKCNLLKENIKKQIINYKNKINLKTNLKNIKKLLYKNFEKDIFILVIEKIKPLLNILISNIKEEYNILKTINNKKLYNEELLDNYIYYGIDFLINQILNKAQKIK